MKVARTVWILTKFNRIVRDGKSEDELRKELAEKLNQVVASEKRAEFYTPVITENSVEVTFDLSKLKNEDNSINTKKVIDEAERIAVDLKGLGNITLDGIEIVKNGQVKTEAISELAGKMLSEVKYNNKTGLPAFLDGGQYENEKFSVTYGGKTFTISMTVDSESDQVDNK